jgi:hypothetical protein
VVYFVQSAEFQHVFLYVSRPCEAAIPIEGEIPSTQRLGEGVADGDEAGSCGLSRALSFAAPISGAAGFPLRGNPMALKEKLWQKN